MTRQRSLRYSSLALATLSLLIPLVAADDATRTRFVKLAQANNGVVKLDSKLHGEIIAPGRELVRCYRIHCPRKGVWLRPLRVCALYSKGSRAASPPPAARNFHPNFQAVAKSWTSVPKDARDRHFFASLDFTDGTSVFRAVRGHSNIWPPVF